MVQKINFLEIIKFEENVNILKKATNHISSHRHHCPGRQTQRQMCRRHLPQ
jgi:hypothetical protein